jgi:hypothetical protein
MNLNNEHIDYINTWKADWNKFAREYFRVTLDPDQAAILEAIQHNRRVSVRSGTARGKDFVAAVASLCFLYLHYPSKVILTAPTDRQVKKIMLSEVKKLYNKALFPLGGKVLNDAITFEKDSTWYLLGFKSSDENTESWTGFHSPNLMVVVTEASGLSQTTFDAIEGILQGNSRLVLCFNPNRASGEAYNSTRSKLYKSFKLNCLNSPNVKAKKIIIPGQVDYKWVKEKLDKGWATPIKETQINKAKHDFQFEGTWYRPTDLFRIKVLGEFPEQSEDILIPLSWIEAANEKWERISKNEEILQQYLSQTLYLGADIAGMGRDLTSLCHRYENYVHRFEPVSSNDHMVASGTIKQILKRKNSYAFIDTIGEGAGVYSRLDEQGVKNAISCKGSYHAKGLTDITGEYKFLNLRAYMYWALRDAINPNNPNSLALPKDEDLTQELTETKWEFGSDGKIKIEPKEKIKERIGRSPDKADSLSYSFYPMSRVQIEKIKPVNIHQLRGMGVHI